MPTATARTTNAADYQRVSRPVAGMAKSFDDGAIIASHRHERDQFCYAVSGVMRVRTRSDAWLVPPDRAVYLPAGVEHSLVMRGPVAMRTVYIAPDADSELPDAASVLAVGPLLRELVVTLIDEPIEYEPDGRGGAIARLLLFEIVRARRLPFAVPMPQDTRLARVCSALLDNPGDPRAFEDWCSVAGASPRTLARLFETEVGLGFLAWRQRVRFHSAMIDLSRGEPIGVVAARCGYRSTSAFSAAFRKVVGQSPKALKRVTA